MKASYPAPSGKVAAYVQDILVLEDCKITSPFVLPLFANGKPTLLFQTSRGDIQGSSNYLTLFGQTVLPDKLTLYDNFTLIAYFFKPFSLTALYGITAKELTDKPVNLGLLHPSRSRTLREQLLHAPSTAAMIDLLDDYIYELTTKIRTDTRLLQYATEKISACPGKDILTATQKELFITERTFQRLFESHIGLSPRQYRKVAQFHTAFQQLNSRQFRQLSDIAFDNHYADQSHFIRTFREFTAMAPGQYLNYGNDE